MAKNVEHVSHIKSKLKTNGLPQLPTADKLVDGEIAINYAEGVETISIRNENSAITTFSSDNYYTEKKLGSGFTNNDATVTEAIDDLEYMVVNKEEAIAAALNDLNGRKLDASAYTPTDLSDYYKKSETSGKTEISNALGGKVNTATFTGHTADTSLHFSGNEKRNLDVLATNIESISGITSNDIANWNAAAGVDMSKYYKKTETSGSTELSTAFSKKADSSALATHTSNATIHITSAERNAWNAKADISDIPSVSSYADSVMYNSTTKCVEFYHGTTAGTKVFEYDASPFLIDGMVQNVGIKNVTSGGSQVTCLVVSFNTDSGKQDINIPISQIFDANNYYTTAQTSGATELQTAFNGKTDTATTTALNNVVTAHTANTNIHLTTTEKGQLHTHTNKTALDSITGNVGTMAYQATTSYSSATQVNTALSNKVDKVSGKGLSTNDYTTDEKNKLSGIASGAQVNVIETVKVNGTALTPASKAVNVTVPTKTSELTNDSNFVSDASYVHTDNNYTTAEKNKLAGIAAGAEVNQNAFSNIKVGSTTVAADSKTDTLEIVGSGIITVSADATNDKITISASNAVTSVAGKTGAVTLAKGDVGLGNVDNTADANKTVKAATSAATADTAKAVALSGVTNAEDLKAIEALTGTTGLLKKTAANTWSLDTNSYSTTAVAVTGATYNSTNKTIDLKNAAGKVVSTVDATAFIKDGMVSNVEVKNVASSGTCLVITFNTDAGKDAINIPISQIFDANNYYTKTDLTGSSTTVVVAKASSATTAASAGSVAWGNVSGKPSSFTPSAHDQASNTITAMTGYAIASASGAVATNDTLNAAIGKLEKRIALLEAALGGMKLVKLTQAQYDALSTKDSNTLYVISD